MQIINNFFHTKLSFFSLNNVKKIKILSTNPLLVLGFIIFFSVIFFSISSLVNKKNKDNENNLVEITKTR